MADSAVLALTSELISRPSVTPDDAGCQQLMADRLTAAGFCCESMRFGEVDNLWAELGDSGPLLVFAGHTDVVPTGELGDWDSDPFKPEVRGDYLYGRGAADMKGSLAAMLLAAEEFASSKAASKLRLGFLITSDEEGPAVDGTVKVMQALEERGKKIDYCVVGEPSSSELLGDTLKNGRRGSLTGLLKIRGVQGHIAYPHLADNPILSSLPALTALYAEQWDRGNEFFQPTSFQISNVNAGTGVGNVIPGELSCLFNFRFSTETSDQELRQRVVDILDERLNDYDIEWTLFGQPFMTARGVLLDASCRAIETVTGRQPDISTAGGTSDGRFIAPYGVQLIELGPVNATIHMVNECVNVNDLEQLQTVYLALINEVANTPV